MGCRLQLFLRNAGFYILGPLTLCEVDFRSGVTLVCVSRDSFAVALKIFSGPRISYFGTLRVARL